MVHKRTNHVPKDVSERDLALSWFESLILPFKNAKFFQIKLLKREKRAFWIVIRVESLILRTCECKALSESDSCVCILEIYARWNHAWVYQRGLCSRNKILPRSAQILFVIGMAFALHKKKLTHVVQITSPITKWIAIKNVFRKMIRFCVNTTIMFSQGRYQWVCL